MNVMPGINFKSCSMHVKRRLTEQEDSTGDHSATDIPLERWHCDKLNKHPQERDRKNRKEEYGGREIRTTR